MNTEIFLNPGTLGFVEELYERYLADPASVSPDWRQYFEREVRPHDPGGLRHPTVRPWSIFNPPTPDGAVAVSLVGTTGELTRTALRLARVQALVNAYRTHGHLMANLDPLGQRRLEPHPELELSTHGFGPADLEMEVPSGGFTGPDTMKLGELVAALKETYSRQIGVEYMGIRDVEMRQWLQERMETTRNRCRLTHDEQRAILEKLSAAEGLEHFLHTRYVGTKRFSLEGAESLIPMLDMLIERAGEQGVDEVVMGMAHRGRLNVVTNLLGQEPSRLFAQFEDIAPMATLGSGDVKYHLGFSNDHLTRGGKRLHLTLTANPSHLEAVNPVVEGRTRAKQDRRGDVDRSRILPILMHGDAAFAGQGLVAETLNLAGLPGYRTGGTLHIVINNQIGFTTPPSSSRSTTYSTDVAKMMEIPIFHVNGEDPESLVQVVRLAVDFRQKFKRDVVIDMFCFRKYGHNEADEPSFTQPLLYKVIDAHPSVHTIYAEQMVRSGTVSRDEADAFVQRGRERLEKELEKIRAEPKAARMSSMGGIWEQYRGGADANIPEVETGVPRELLREITERLVQLPDHFTPHRKTIRLMAQRLAMGRGELELDWGMAETLAYGTLLWNGVNVRLSGQDSRRGTFSHRHAVRTDVVNGQEYIPLANLKPGQGHFYVYDSSLSEAGVLGFDYGYSLDSPDALVIWEAQFGDFVNGAQVIIDQFIVSAEDKWGRLSGLVMLLPHGFEGQGPEHSSARLERFLKQCARDNIQVCNCTTPAQVFHLLRRQVIRPWRKPLIVMSPKSLLRHPAATSPLVDLTYGNFQRLIPDPSPVDAAAVRRLLLCSGKFYYELLEERQKRQIPNLPIVRLEQLYPFPSEQLLEILSRYPSLEEIAWCQEEPRNMGALDFIRLRLMDMLGTRYRLPGFSRAEAASPATGSAKAHAIETRMLQDQIFRDSQGQG